MDSPTHYEPTLLDRARMERELPYSTAACPDLEALVILDLVKKGPPCRKSTLVTKAQAIIGGARWDDRSMYVFIDSLVATKDLCKYDCYFHMTPGGEARLLRLRTQLRVPLMRSL